MNLCQCGCGKPAPIAKQSHTKKGWIKGQPLKYIYGHNLKIYKRGKKENSGAWRGGIINVNGYISIFLPSHPSSTKTGYVKRSRLVAEKALGKLLPKNAVMHHVNEDTTNDENTNLVVCENAGYHMYIHMKKRAYDACGHANWRICKYCKQYDKPENLYIPNNGGSYHKKCRSINETRT